MSERARKVVKQVKNPSKMGQKGLKLSNMWSEGLSGDVNGLCRCIGRRVVKIIQSKEWMPKWILKSV